MLELIVPSSMSHTLVPPFVPTNLRRPRRVVTKSMGHSGVIKPKDKVVLITGTTGTGKSRLSVDLATRFSAEIINSDKMQIYKGLEIASNLIPVDEQGGVPHHLLGEFEGEMTPAEFRTLATLSISEVLTRGKLPIVVGGSNSFNHALLAERFDPETDPFAPKSSLSSICSDLRYKCCILWVDVSEHVLFQHLANRVDKMIEVGLLEQLAAYYDPVVDSGPRLGVRKTIGVEEFDKYFRVYPREMNEGVWDLARKTAYEEAVKVMKERTCKLVQRQKAKIKKLIKGGWKIKRLDATAAITAELYQSTALEAGKSKREIWEKDIVEESVKIVNRFLLEG